MRNSNPPLSSSDKGFTLIIMLSSLVIISLLYLLVGSSHQVHHKDAQREILYTSDNAIMPPVNTTLNQDDINKVKEKERLDQLNSLNIKMKQAEGLLDSYSSSLSLNHKIFKFTSKRLFTSLTAESLAEKSIKYRDEGSSLPAFSCAFWAVVATPRPLSSTIGKFITYNRWCLVVVGDQKGEKLYFSDERNSTAAETASSLNYFYLSYEDQTVNLAHKFSLINNLPNNHLGKKMIGYLFALQHGALVIYDFDDMQSITSNSFKHGIFSWIRDQGHQLKLSTSGAFGEDHKTGKDERRRRLRHSTDMEKKRRLNSHSTPSQALNSNTSDIGGGTSSGGTGKVLTVNELSNNSNIFINSFSLLSSDHRPSWPRGYPINALQPSEGSSEDSVPLASLPSLQSKEVTIDSIGILHFLCNDHADVDRRYEMIFSQPFHFPVKGQLPFLLPATRSFAPYNALSTVFFQSMLWSLYLPISVNSRLSDIIRSYITERIVQEVNHLYAAQINATISQRKEIRILFHAPITIRQKMIKDVTSPVASSLDGNNTTQRGKGAVMDLLRGYTKDYHSDVIFTILVSELQSLTLKSATVPGMLEEVYIFLYEIGFLDKSDVMAVQQWLQHLLEVNYAFPSLLQPHATNSAEETNKKEGVKREEIAVNLINN